MNHSILTYIGAFSVIVWGISHLIPTRAVVRGFGDVSDDNKRIVAMEWITEGVALLFIGFLVAATTYFDGTSALAKVVYASAVVMLNVMSVISLFTGFKNAFIPFKLCPFIFTGSSILIYVGSM